MEINNPLSMSTLLIDCKQASIILLPCEDKLHGLFSSAIKESKVAFSITTSNDSA